MAAPQRGHGRPSRRKTRRAWTFSPRRCAIEARWAALPRLVRGWRCRGQAPDGWRHTSLNLLGRKNGADAAGMQGAFPKCFVHIDIAQSSDEGLVRSRVEPARRQHRRSERTGVKASSEARRPAHPAPDRHPQAGCPNLRGSCRHSRPSLKVVPGRGVGVDDRDADTAAGHAQVHEHARGLSSSKTRYLPRLPTCRMRWPRCRDKVGVATAGPVDVAR